jgi:hypothetical protein
MAVITPAVIIRRRYLIPLSSHSHFVNVIFHLGVSTVAVVVVTIDTNHAFAMIIPVVIAAAALVVLIIVVFVQRLHATSVLPISVHGINKGHTA